MTLLLPPGGASVKSDPVLDLKRELRIPLLVTFISFFFWIFVEIPAAQYVLCAFLGVLVLKNPIIGISFLLANELFIGSAPPVLAGVSLTQIIGGFCVFACLVQKRRFPSIFNPVTLVAFAITVVYSVSYWHYFQQMDTTILNNLIFLFFTLWVFDFQSPHALRQVGFTLLLANMLLVGISIVYFINNPDDLHGTPFGNARQIGFFGVLLIPYIYIISNISKKMKGVNFAILLTIGIIITYNFATISRLNIFTIFIMLIILSNKKFHPFLLSRRLLYATFSIAILLLFSQNILDTYMYRGLANISKYSTITTLDEKEIGALTSGRAAIYEYGMEMYRDYPLFGGGYKRWGDISNKYNPFISSTGSERLSMHSTHLQYLAETGIFGLSLYWAFLGIIGYNSWRTIKHTNNSTDSPVFLCGSLGFFVAIIMFLGGTFDNHGIQYRQLFFAAAATASISPVHFAWKQYRQ